MPRTTARKVLEIEADAIRALSPRLDESFDRAVATLHACAGRVVATGMGKSEFIAQKISATLASTGTPSLFLHPAEAIHGDLGRIVKGNVLLAVSNSGDTEEILALVPWVKRTIGAWMCRGRALAWRWRCGRTELPAEIWGWGGRLWLEGCSEARTGVPGHPVLGLARGCRRAAGRSN
jgi:hypothetical protein